MVDNGADCGKESGGGTGVAEVQLAAFLRDSEGALAAFDDDRIASVFPGEVGALYFSSSPGWK